MKKSGLTLVEIMIAVFLSSLVLGTAYTIFSSARRNVSTATARQLIGDEIKLAISKMAKDFRAIKMGSLVVTADTNGNSANIKFQRYSLSSNETKDAAYKHIDNVEYIYQKPFLKRKINSKGAKTLSKHVTALDLTRGGTKENHTTKDFSADLRDRERALNARMDISLTGSIMVNATARTEDHTERTSVFMREEFNNTVSEKRYLSMLKMFEKNALKEEERLLDSYLNDGNQLFSEEELMKLDASQLGELKLQEQAGYQKSFSELGEIDKQIKDADTKLDRWWFFGKKTEVTDIQKDLKKIKISNKDDSTSLKEKSKNIEKEKEKLQKLIEKYEVKNMRNAFGDKYGNLQNLSKSDPKKYEQLKEVYDMMIRDQAMKEIHGEQNKNKSKGDKPKFVDFIERNNPSNIVRGVAYDALGTAINITESEEDFAARKAQAQRYHNIATQMSMDWTKTKEGEDDIKHYTSAKNLFDLADTKSSQIETLFRHKSNLEKILKVLKKK